jgi:hypothetical protein
MLKIRDIKARDRGKIYDLMQLYELCKPGEIEAILHRIDFSLFDDEQRLYRVIIAENENKELMGYAVFGPDPQAVKTYQIYNLVPSPRIKNGEIIVNLLRYIEDKIVKYRGRIIVIELSSHFRYKNQYETYLKENYNLSSKINNLYSEGEDKLILAKNLASSSG